MSIGTKPAELRALADDELLNKLRETKSNAI